MVRVERGLELEAEVGQALEEPAPTLEDVLLAEDRLPGRRPKTLAVGSST